MAHEQETPIATPPVGSEYRCVGCGYDIGGLPVGGNCSECGRALEDSIGEHLLINQDREWLEESLRGGAGAIIAGDIGTLVFPFFMLFCVTGGLVSPGEIFVALMVAFAGAALIRLGGAMGMTQARGSPLPASSLRRMRRVEWTMLGLMAAPLMFALFVVSWRTGTEFVFLSFLALSVSAHALETRYMLGFVREVAKLVPSEALARRNSLATVIVDVLMFTPILLLAGLIVELETQVGRSWSSFGFLVGAWAAMGLFTLLGYLWMIGRRIRVLILLWRGASRALEGHERRRKAASLAQKPG